MSEKKSNGEQEELDFVTGSSFQKSIKKAKRKQTIKFFLIGTISTLVVLYGLFLWAEYRLTNRLVNDEGANIYSMVNGANVYQVSQYNTYGFLSAISYTTMEKTMGDRTIVWDVIEKEVPAFGRVSVLGGGVSVTTFNERFNRVVHYNNYNKEKEVDFYYPQLDYEFLPDELGIATTKLDDNTLAEVALSFDRPYTLAELEKIMGRENVNWLWVHTTSEKKLKELADPNQVAHPDNVMSGPSADGFQVDREDFTEGGGGFLSFIKLLSEEGKYKSAVKKMANGIKEGAFPTVEDIRITGAVVTGTPQELERFQKLGIVRASTLGATIDLY